MNQNTTRPRSEEVQRLLRRSAARIAEEPRSYDQGHYARPAICGTAHCVAGHVLREAGITIDSFGFFGSVGHRVPSWDRAKELLELGNYEAQILFSTNWKPKLGTTVPQALRALADGKGIDEVTETIPGPCRYDSTAVESVIHD